MLCSTGFENITVQIICILVLIFRVSIQWQISRWGKDPLGVWCQPLTRALFGRNVCENKRTGSHWAEHVLVEPPGSENGFKCLNWNFKSQLNNLLFFPNWQDSLPIAKLKLIGHALLSTNFNTHQYHLVIQPYSLQPYSLTVLQLWMCCGIH